jgi:RNA-binding protein
MALTSKQRAYLGAQANPIDPIFQVGKGSLTPELITALDEALEKRELIKISVLKNCADDPAELASVIAERTRAEVVKVIGKKIILFRQNKKQSKFELPRA